MNKQKANYSDGITRIALWSGPRNISTALMYSFAQRADTRVYDEPLYAHYLTVRPAVQAYHPGAPQILRSQSHDGRAVVASMLGAQPKPVVFFKHMGHHLVDLDLDFLGSLHNVILTRDPEQMLPSYAAVVDTPTLTDVGYAAQVELYEHLTARGEPVTVLDAKRVLLDPAAVLQQLCARLGIPFDEAMLHWPAGARPEDGVWAPHWYASVHASTGFAPYRAKTAPFPERLKPLLAECQPNYALLRAVAL